MKSKTLLMMSSAIAVLASIGLFISVSYAQENMTSAANETGAIMETKQIKQEEIRLNKDQLNNSEKH